MARGRFGAVCLAACLILKLAKKSGCAANRKKNEKNPKFDRDHVARGSSGLQAPSPQCAQQKLR